MKTYFLPLLCFIFLEGELLAQSIRFDTVLKVPTTEFNATIDATVNGGNISFNREYKTNCVGTYAIQWSFDKDISTLRNGEQFNLTITCANCNTPCGYKWKIANAHTSGLSEALVPGYIYNQNIKLLSTTAGPFGVHDWTPGHSSHTYTFIYEQKKQAPITSFMLDFGGFKLHYVFRTASNHNDETDIMEGPNLSCVWSSNFGNINWQEGWYGNPTKTLSGDLHLENGRYVYRGTWGRTNSSSSGSVVFYFSENNRSFTGYYTRGTGTKEFNWSGQLDCN